MKQYGVHDVAFYIKQMIINTKENITMSTGSVS